MAAAAASNDDMMKEYGGVNELEEMFRVRSDAPLGGLMSFNIEYGFLEALVRGLRSGFITDYKPIKGAEHLDDLKMALSETDMQDTLKDIGSVSRLTSNVIIDRVRDKYIREFRFLQTQAVGQLGSFLDYITFGKQIEAIQQVMSGVIRNVPPATIMQRIHPLGYSPLLKRALMFDNKGEEDALLILYKIVLQDTPVAIYYERFFNARAQKGGDKGGMGGEIHRLYNETSIDYISAYLEKLWLEDFYRYCENLGGDTWAIMKELLDFEADRRAIQIVYNSFTNGLAKPEKRDGERREIMCSFGKLYPELTHSNTGFVQVGDEKDVEGSIKQLGEKLEKYRDYYAIWLKSQQPDFQGGLDQAFFQHEVKLMEWAFDGQSHFACFYAWLKLKERETENLRWIAECILNKLPAYNFQRVVPIFSKERD